jgi:putative hydrolase of the HAD superfamily
VTRQIDAVLFDFAGVLTMPVMSRLTELSGAAGLGPDGIRSALMGDYGTGDPTIDRHPWHQLERGEITVGEYGVLAHDTLHAVGLGDFVKNIGRGFSGAGVRDSMVDLARRLRAIGVRTAILSNNLAEFRDNWTGMIDAYNLVDHVIDSSEIGMRKPEARIYLHDDLAANVDGARRVGIHGIHVDETAHDAITEVEQLTGL